MNLVTSLNKIKIKFSDDLLSLIAAAVSQKMKGENVTYLKYT